jgi:hypothetical protein
LIFEDRCRFCPQAERCFSGAPLLAQQQTEPRIAFVVGNAGYGAGGAADRAQTTRDSSPRRCAASALKSSKAQI